MDAEQTLVEVRRLRAQARARAHGGAWLPAAAIAALLLASIALYRWPFGQTSSIVAEYPFWAGVADEQRSPMLSYLFWFLGTPLVVGLTAAWYRRRERVSGMRVAWPLFAAAGLGVLVLLAVLAAAPSGPQPDALSAAGPWWPGFLTPLLPVAAGVVALGVAERSRALVAAGVWIALMAVWLCQWWPLGTIPGGMLSLRPGHYLVVMALPLLVFAAVRYARGRTAGD
ncbi:hypothetical protein K1W54_26485 [Micromonospora sp. CPCC 205371]|nr:hypothetical protein [Micromonospora sp. CPCC 205371]